MEGSRPRALTVPSAPRPAPRRVDALLVEDEVVVAQQRLLALAVAQVVGRERGAGQDVVLEHLTGRRWKRTGGGKEEQVEPQAGMVEV